MPKKNFWHVAPQNSRWLFRRTVSHFIFRPRSFTIPNNLIGFSAPLAIPSYDSSLHKTAIIPMQVKSTWNYPGPGIKSRKGRGGGQFSRRISSKPKQPKLTTLFAHRVTTSLLLLSMLLLGQWGRKWYSWTVSSQGKKKWFRERSAITKDNRAYKFISSLSHIELLLAERSNERLNREN